MGDCFEQATVLVTSVKIISSKKKRRALIVLRSDILFASFLTGIIGWYNHHTTDKTDCSADNRYNYIYPMTTSLLLSIKLHRPAPPAKSVSRPALVRRLNEGLEAGRPITLVSAPAGFGKTTCINEWLAGLGLPAAWLSLDADDNDPGRFFTYLFAALERIKKALGRAAFAHSSELESVLRSGQLPPLEVIANSLVADVMEIAPGDLQSPGDLPAPSKFLLVLDDFHLIQERFILKVFEKLAASLFQPNLPQPLHLVLLTREDPELPLARLRASNQLTEIRAADLRFNADEAGRFLNEVMDLTLSPAEVTTLEDKTEGWVVGLQLAGLSIRGRSDPARFIAGLRGSQRFILSYLTEEVLGRQPEDVQQFLLETSILDRLSGSLCNAVTGRADSQALLEQLWNANLFLVPLDDSFGEAEANWFRYHHLFADLLRNRLGVLAGEKKAELHRRASRWFAQACAESAFSERAGLASQAIEHALAAADYAAAAQLIETYAMEILNQWYAKTVSAWMQALPPEWSAQSPKINLAFAQTHLMRADLAQAAPYLARLQALFSAPQSWASEIDPTVRAEWLAMQAILLNAQGRPAEALTLAGQALEIAPESGALQADALRAGSSARSQAYLATAVAYQQLDDPQRAEEAFQQVIQSGRSTGDLISEMLGLSALSLMLIERGQLRYGYELARQAAERAERAGVFSPICAGIYGELGQIAFHWNQMEQAEQYLRRSAQVSGLMGFSDAEIYYHIARSRLCCIQGDLASAAREMQKAQDLIRVDAPTVVRTEVIEQQVLLALAQNDLAAAEQILIQETELAHGKRALPYLEPGQTVLYPQGMVYLSTLRFLLYRARSKGGPESAAAAADLERGIEQAGLLLAALHQRQYIPLELQALLLRAQMHAAREDASANMASAKLAGASLTKGSPAEASLADYSAALDLAEPEGYLSDFLKEGRPAAAALRTLYQRSQPGSSRAEYLQRILEAFPGLPGSALHSPPPAQDGAQAGALAHGASAGLAALPEPLTEREGEVLRLIAEGLKYEEIAARLYISLNTVRTHVKEIYGKLEVNSRSQAVAQAQRLKLL